MFFDLVLVVTRSNDMSVIRSIIPMRSSTTQAAARNEVGELSYVTVLAESHGLRTDPDAAQGVFALHRSLRRVGAAHPLLCVCVSVSNATRARLMHAGVQVREATPIARVLPGRLPDGSPSNPAAFATLQVLRLVEYRRLVYLDYDTLVIRNIDHLFSLRLCDFAFAPDIGADVSALRMYKVNSGVFVHAPNPTVRRRTAFLVGQRSLCEGQRRHGSHAVAAQQHRSDRADQQHVNPHVNPVVFLVSTSVLSVLLPTRVLPQTLNQIMEHKDTFEFDHEGGFLQAFINENRGRLDDRMNICDLVPL